MTKSKRIPVSVAERIAKEHNQQQVILVTWDGALTHVVTYGTTVEACDQAAMGGDRIKDALGWPKSLKTAPSRVKALRREIKHLQEALNRGS